MKLVLKLITEIRRFIILRNFALFQITWLCIATHGSILVSNILDISVFITLVICFGLFSFINFIMLNNFFGKRLFNDRCIWPIQFFMWETVEPSINTTETNLAVEWCFTNCKGSWRQTVNNWFLFTNKDDAMLFRLSW